MGMFVDFQFGPILKFSLPYFNFTGAYEKCVIILRIFLILSVLMLSLIKNYVFQKSSFISVMSLNQHEFLPMIEKIIVAASPLRKMKQRYIK